MVIVGVQSAAVSPLGDWPNGKRSVGRKKTPRHLVTGHRRVLGTARRSGRGPSGRWLVRAGAIPQIG